MGNERVTAVISHGARNITKPVETIFGKCRPLHCFAHQLNLVVERALLHHDDIKVLIKKVIVYYIPKRQVLHSCRENNCLQRGLPSR
jgi:hypothetical protein